jgi:hypothetical protein
MKLTPEQCREIISRIRIAEDPANELCYDALFEYIEGLILKTLEVAAVACENRPMDMSETGTDRHEGCAKLIRSIEFQEHHRQCLEEG